MSMKWQENRHTERSRRSKVFLRKISQPLKGNSNAFQLAREFDYEYGAFQQGEKKY